MNARMWALPLATLAAIVAATAAGAAGSKSYTDPAGDSGDAPDVVRVDVSNDDEGLLTFALRFQNRAALRLDDAIVIGIDSDRNARTGDADGAEYTIYTMLGGLISGLGKWNGGDYDWAAPQRTLRTQDGATVQVHRSEVGNAAAFDFFTASFSGWDEEDEPTSYDFAPDGTAAWTYELKLTPQLRSFTGSFTPSSPQAGKRFALTRVQIALADGKVVRADGMRCTAKLAGRALAPVGPCAWKLPAGAKGKKLVVTSTVTYRGASGVAGPFAFTVGG